MPRQQAGWSGHDDDDDEMSVPLVEETGAPRGNYDFLLIKITQRLGLGLLGFNTSATARVISRLWNDDDEMSNSKVCRTSTGLLNPP